MAATPAQGCFSNFLGRSEEKHVKNIFYWNDLIHLVFDLQKGNACSMLLFWGGCEVGSELAEVFATLFPSLLAPVSIQM